MQLRLFLIDDDDIQNDIMEEYIDLCEVDATAEFHSDSSKAVEVLQNSAIDQLPHVIFIDLNMPGMNGWDILNSLQTIFDNQQWQPSVFMASSSVLESDLLKAQSIPHLKKFLNKPIRLAELKELLADEYVGHCS